MVAVIFRKQNQVYWILEPVYKSASSVEQQIELEIEKKTWTKMLEKIQDC
jgi:hypothetical protein